MKTPWRLPRGVDEVLPPAAWELELLRRKVLDLFVGWGFEYVEPPVIEYLDALLVGSGEDLDLQTLKVVDQVSGQQLGVRADMTSQAVRIDAHSLNSDGVARLCYAGPVVFANPQIAQTSRVPMKAGAEIFGAPSLAADAEVVALMLHTIAAAGISQPVLLLGHMGIYRGLVDALLDTGALHPGQERELFNCVQRKSQADIKTLLDDSELARMMVSLPLLMGGVERLAEARQALRAAPASVLGAVDDLATLAARVRQDIPDVSLRVDVSELSGYGYHNGPVFAVYHPEHGQALAQGGRYDGVGAAFGRQRPATGFDVNLKNLIGVAQNNDVVHAPYIEGEQRAALLSAVAALRAEGQRVRFALSATEPPAADCRRQLEWINEAWQITPYAN